MIIFLIPIEFILGIFLLGAGAIDITASWMQTIEAHYLFIALVVIGISFAIVFSSCLYGKMLIFHKVILLMVFFLVAGTVVGNWGIWYTKAEQKRQLEGFNKSFEVYMQTHGEDIENNHNNNDSHDDNKSKVIAELFYNMKDSLGYLCVCMAVIPILGYIAYQMKIYGTKFICTILMCGFILYGIQMFKEMVMNFNSFIA